VLVAPAHIVFCTCWRCPVPSAATSCVRVARRSPGCPARSGRPTSTTSARTPCARAATGSPCPVRRCVDRQRTWIPSRTDLAVASPASTRASARVTGRLDGHHRLDERAEGDLPRYVVLGSARPKSRSAADGAAPLLVDSEMGST